MGDRGATKTTCPRATRRFGKKASSLLGVFAARDNRIDAARERRRPVGLAVISLVRHRDARTDVGADVERRLELCAVAGRWCRDAGRFAIRLGRSEDQARTETGLP